MDDVKESRSCGEPRAEARQSGRRGLIGRLVLSSSLEWVGRDDLTGIRSPALHSGRAYVSDAEYESSMRELFRAVAQSTFVGHVFLADGMYGANFTEDFARVLAST